MADKDPVLDGFDMTDTEQRREFLQLMMLDPGALASFTESLGQDGTPFFIQALAHELVVTSLALMELTEKVQGIEILAKASGSMMSGLMGIEQRLEVGPDDNVELVGFQNAVRKCGFMIREGAGLATS